MTDYEITYNTFWKGIVEKDGKLDLELVMRELHDFRIVMGNATLVYDHVTGGRITKLLTDPNAVCSVADDHYAALYGERESPESPLRTETAAAEGSPARSDS